MRKEEIKQTKIVVVNPDGLVLLYKTRGNTVTEFYNSLLFVIGESTRLKTNLLEKRADYFKSVVKLDSKYPKLFIKALHYHKRLLSKNNLSVKSQFTIDGYCKQFVEYFSGIKKIELSFN